MTIDTTLAQTIHSTFEDALQSFRSDRPTLIVSHNDADGLSAAAILARALQQDGCSIRTRILGRGEMPWSPEIQAEIQTFEPGGLIVSDLGTRSETVVAGLPTIIIDHHVPTGRPSDATLITGFDLDPVPTSSLLAFWAAGSPASLLWLAAIGLIGDMAEGAGFPEMDEARKTYGVTALRAAVTLINAPRRSASGDVGPALKLLMEGDGPKHVTSSDSAETAALKAAKAEVSATLDAAKRIGPKVVDKVALVRFDTPCQVHPLLAQIWRGRLKDRIVLAANAAYRPGWVHFAARTATDANLIDFLAEHAPPGADKNYGNGHIKAAGGALRPADWNHFIAKLGFGPEQQVTA